MSTYITLALVILAFIWIIKSMSRVLIRLFDQGR